MPQLVYLKFEDAAWQVHPSLPKGIWPLHPVYRTWNLTNTGERVRRKGFTLVPDYASTAFMKQGETLPAEIGDCGDIFTAPHMTESLTAYVMLSRITRIDTLLLTRAFSPDLFRLGPSPGPACLLKLLRRRFANGHPGNLKAFSETEARREYLRKAACSAAERKQRKARGLVWPCFMCGLHLSAEGFGAASWSTKDVREKCITPGGFKSKMHCNCTRERHHAQHIAKKHR